MNARIVTVLDLDKDVQAARNATRSILAAADNLSVEAALRPRVEKAAAIAAAHAAAVDRESRFPQEAITAVRAERLLGIAVPQELGGEGASISDIADVCYALGRACASTAMIYAMHQMKVACIVRHGRSSAWHQGLLRRLCAEQLLLASSTTEGQSRRRCPLQRGADRASRRAHHARAQRDGHFLRRGTPTASSRRRGAPRTRRAPTRFLSCFSRPITRSSRSRAGTRSACAAPAAPASGSRRRRERADPAGRYEKIHAQTMMPVAHLLWSSAWAGIAAGGRRARARFRAQGARSAPAARCRRRAAHLTRANASLRSLRSLIATALQPFRGAPMRRRRSRSIDFQTAHQPAEGRRLRARGRDRDERDAVPAAFRAIATTANSPSAGICATFCRRRS